MKEKKRITSTVLTVLLGASLFSGCSLYQDEEKATAPPPAQETESGTKPAESTNPLAANWPEFNKHHEVKIVCMEMGWTGPEKDKDFVTPEIEKRTNFKLNYEPMTLATGDDLNQKLNLMVASGDIPDVFFGQSDAYSRSIYTKLGQSNLIWDILPTIKNYKNIYDLVKPELTLFQEKGGINYFIPTQTGRGNDPIHSAASGLFLRDDLLKKLNMTYPTTPQEVYTYLKRSKEEIKTIDGKSIIPYTLDENLGGVDNLMVGFYPFKTGDRGFTFDKNDNFKVKNYLYTDSPELMKAAKFVNQLYREGLIEKESLTQKKAQFQEKVSSGRVAAMSNAWWDMNTLSDNAKAVVPDLMYVANPQLEDKEIGASGFADAKWTNGIYSWSTLTVSKKVDEETLKHFIAALDYLATKDGQLLVQVGIEGKSYNFDENGKYTFTDEFKKQTENLDWNKGSSYGVFYWQQLVMNLPVYDNLRAEYPELVREDNKKGWDNQQPVRDLYEPNMTPTKDYYFVAGPVEIQKLPAIDDARSEMYAKVLVAKSEAEVEQIIHNWGKTCKDMGIDDIIKERQAYMDSLDENGQKK
jgi:putative aldouronate transport system substrate-binding protein